MLTVASATATAGLVLFDDVADDIRQIPDLEEETLPEPEPGEPYTLLLLGSDRRPQLPDERSDTTMLLRLDPDRRVIAMLSFPRDLLVSIPGYGSDKLNAAYTEGGPKLTLQTVELLTGLKVNEVVDTDFQGFADAVNAIGCAYIDVDQKYYNPPGAGYAEIDINAGYQRLCGLKALQYVRYRHTDNDVVRAARQQSFLREARQRVGVRSLLFGGDAGELIDAFVDNTRSTIKGGGEVRDLARTIFDLRGVSPVQIQVDGDLGEEDIIATDGEIQRAVDRFLGGEEKSNGDSSSGEDGTGSVSDTPAEADRERKKAKEARAELSAAGPEFAQYARTASRRLGFDAYYPQVLAEGSGFSRDSRTYQYLNEEDEPEKAYKLVITHPEPTIITEYYGVSGTTWNDPPILRDPTEIKTVDGRDLLLFYSGSRLRLVGWKDGGNSYWVSNSLLASLSDREMLGIATSMAKA